MSRVRGTFIAICLIIVILLVSGCAERTDLTAIVIVGNHQNAKKFPVSIDDDLYNISGKNLLDVYVDGGQVYFICIDGCPTVEYTAENEPVGKVSEEVYSKYKDNEYILAKKLKKEIESLYSVAETLAPNNAEVDTLAALTEAESIFENDYRQERRIIIYDTGLCTTGGLNFCTGDYFESDITEIVKEMKAELLIPVLEDVSITWYGLGEVEEPQQQLTNLQKKKLQEIWTAIITESGATVEFKGVKHNDKLNANTYNQPVSVVNFNEIERREIQFVGGCDVFKKPEEANDTIEDLVALMKKHPDLEWWIVGCTASVAPEKEYDYIDLSKKRAIAVKKELVSRGIPQEKIFLSALGFKNPWHINNLDETNRQIDEYAEDNRKAYILPVNHSEYRDNYDKITEGQFK